jgi:lipopolysaccharide heptosyltransferase II
VDWYLGVLTFLDVPINRQFQWLPIRSEASETVQKQRPENTRWIILQPGARRINKRWPVEFFADLVRRLAPVHRDIRFAILGSRDERPLGEAIVKADSQRCLDLTGKLGLLEMVEWIRASELMVTNDTGPMHVAAALGRPVIALFGPTEPRRTGPYGQIQNALQWTLPCVPCMKPRCHYFKPFECLRALGPETVFEAVQKRLAPSQPS